jgi:hypothetical protein
MQRAYFSPTALREHMVTILKELISARDLARTLTRAGFEPARLVAKHEGETMQSRFWRSPPDWLSEGNDDA